MAKKVELEHLTWLTQHRAGLYVLKFALLGLIYFGATGRTALAQSTCKDRATATVQVLGSGGPMHGGGRGSAAYLLWYKGRPSMLIDDGAGTSVALARIGVEENDLETILLSHLHPDHVSDLPDLFWGMAVENRTLPVRIVGPTGVGEFLGVRTFLSRLFGSGGAFPFMKDVLDGRAFPVHIQEVNAAHGSGAEEVFQEGDLKVLAYPVEHGKVPTLAYRVNGPGFSVVFSADQTARDRGFAQFAAGTDLLILHAILNQAGRDSELAKDVAVPGDLADTAAEAKPKKLLLGHLMLEPRADGHPEVWSLADTSSITAAIRTRYHGPIAYTSDLACYLLPGGR